MIYLIDNYDSFTYNLYQLVGELTDEPIIVIKNDELTVEELAFRNPSKLIFSPGPGRPEDAGHMLDQLKYFIGRVPILGVCLGHQAIAEVYGGKVVHAPVLMHGKSSNIQLVHGGKIFEGCPHSFTGARYHSLIVTDLPDKLNITAQTSNHEIMAIADEDNKVYGVQFHPESIMTDKEIGQQIIKNFIKLN
ncbi:anthranilate synthase component II [Companilactobacillus jidongensis]|uniref:anthranilate synthase component II n=1 Tax=Companilactobacillus jidongensis TaxID=2486006 RepID=UPI000F793EDF|nr:aminodeoxychorismate/anthranilate synthase component II [Companilactobacillus jidongensis]